MVVEQIVLVLLIVFALFTVFARNLKHAIISSSVFGLWVSFVYLLYHAPDVAVAEAVVASSLGTILYIITIKKYNDISVRPRRSYFFKIKRSYAALIEVLLVISCGLVLYLTSRTEVITTAPLFEYVMNNFFINGSRINPVGNIYLNYRIFDTIFEALMLLVSGIGVIHLIRHKGGASNEEVK